LAGTRLAAADFDNRRFADGCLTGPRLAGPRLAGPRLVGVCLVGVCLVGVRLVGVRVAPDFLAAGRLRAAATATAAFLAFAERRAGSGGRAEFVEPRRDVEVRASLTAPPRPPPRFVVDPGVEDAGRREA
jgi:hypothetical protein